jgi:hypothetical protein
MSPAEPGLFAAADLTDGRDIRTPWQAGLSFETRKADRGVACSGCRRNRPSTCLREAAIDAGRRVRRQKRPRPCVPAGRGGEADPTIRMLGTLLTSPTRRARVRARHRDVRPPATNGCAWRALARASPACGKSFRASGVVGTMAASALVRKQRQEKLASPQRSERVGNAPRRSARRHRQ